MADFVVMDNTIPGVFLNAWHGLSDHKFERVFGLITQHKADVRNLVVFVDYADLVLLVLNSNHTSENHHLNARNYYTQIKHNFH